MIPRIPPIEPIKVRTALSDNIPNMAEATPVALANVPEVKGCSLMLVVMKLISAILVVFSYCIALAIWVSLGMKYLTIAVLFIVFIGCKKESNEAIRSNSFKAKIETDSVFAGKVIGKPIL